MEINKQELEAIEGAKGGGGASTPVYAPNTLATRAIVRVVDIPSEGEIEGFVGGGRGIFINGTPLINADGTSNFTRAAFETRVGLPDQPYLAGFPFVENEVTVNTEITFSDAVIRSVSSAAVDAVRVTIGFPEGLVEQLANGDMVGATVQIALDHKLSSSGAWINYATHTISDVSYSATSLSYLVPRPAGAGLFDVRARRLTADTTVPTLRNTTQWTRMTEIQDVKLSYNDSAVVGLAVDAEAIGGATPTRGYLIKGVRCRVPVNYDPETREYTGIWNGAFKTAWTDNPAWCLYDMFTHPRYGMGEFISESMVDPFGFYDAAVYNDELVDDGFGGLEPRYTFNAVLDTRTEHLRLLNMMASSMRASLLHMRGQVVLIQDRPADPVMSVNNSNVIDGVFNYKSSSLQERSTAFHVTYNDRTDSYLQNIVTIDASTTTGAFQTQLENAQNRYGYNPTEILAVGTVTQGQARRAGLWAADTVLNQTEIVQFKMGYEGFAVKPGDIVQVYDEEYTTTPGQGRLVSVVGSTVTLDRPINIVPGSSIDVALADGTLQRRSIVETSGSLSVVTVDTPFSSAVSLQSPFILRTTVEPRQFRIIGIRQEEPHIISIEAVYHDPNKYSRIELGLNIPAPVFSAAQPTITTAPTSLSFREIQVNNADDGVNGFRRSLAISWIAPIAGIPLRYVVRYRIDGGAWQSVETGNRSHVIEPAVTGFYEVEVFTISVQGNVGPSTSGTYTISTLGGSLSLLYAPTSLQVVGGGTTFLGNSLDVEWTYPASNIDVLDATLRDFQVQIVDASGPTVLRTEYRPAVGLGLRQTFSYTMAMNESDGGPRRNIQVQVRCRDMSGNLSTAASVAFANPAPAAVTGFTTVGSFGSNFLSWNANTEGDLRGYIVWRGTSAGFTPSSVNRVFDGYATSMVDSGLPDGTTYYYKIAAYDSFGRSDAGTGLNIVTSSSVTTRDAATPNEYMLTGVTWTPNSPSTNRVAWTACTAIKTGGTGAGGTWAIAAGDAPWTSGVLYLYYEEGNTTISSTSSIVTATGASKVIVATYRGGTNLEHGDGRAYIDGSLVLAGTVGAAQLVTGSAVITESAQIANAIVTGDMVVDGTLEANKLNVISLAAISATLGDVNAGSVRGGDFTGYEWPTTGGGFYLGPSGLLLGRAASGQYFQVTAAGAISAPGFSVSGGVLTISQANVINALNIAGNSIGITASASGGAATVSTTITVPAGETWRVVIIGTQNAGAASAMGSPDPGNATLYLPTGSATLMTVSKVFDTGESSVTQYFYPSAAIGGAGSYGPGTHTISFTGVSGFTKTLAVLGTRK